MFSVIVAMDNHYELTSNFFERLLQTTNFAKGELIVVVDGCNDSRTVEYLQKLNLSKSFVKVIFLESKLGVSRANNIGVENCQYENLVFINTDVFPNDESIEKLVDYINSDDTIGVAQGRLIYPQNNKIQSTGHTFEYCYNAHLYKGKDCDDPVVLKIAERQALTSAFYAMKKETFTYFGGFDEVYYNAYEGMELTLKIHQSGLKCMYYPEALAYHITGGSRNNIDYDNEYSGRIFWSKWHNRIYCDLTCYLKEQMTSKIKANTYFRINCSGFSFWDKVLEELELNISGSINVKNKYANNLNLYNELPYEMLRFNEPLLFTCNDIDNLKGNYNWNEVRHNSNDIVLDSHGNLEKLSNIVGEN